jgi:uncharacterized tellurite resistance protein B-like protein
VVSVVLNEFRVRDSSISEVVVVIERIGHDTLEHASFESELTSDS